MIQRSFIEQLLSSCDIEDIMASYINLKRAGRNLKALCPFHSEKTASFVVYPESQSFYCFGCGAGGDVISFIMKAENLDYVEAIRFLAKRVGLTVPEDDNDELTKLKSRILQMNKEAARFFHSCLKQPIGKKGLAYLKNRGLSDSAITSYGLGYAPDSFDALKNFLSSKGYTQKEMYSAALLAKSRNGHYYDQFRNRVMFPIIDLRGNVIAFGGRVLDDSKPKYLNSADTPVFKKSRNLFSLNLAKNEIKDSIILAEGYMDVISIYSAGFKNVVATLGTSLTQDQARLMAKYAKDALIAYDSDGAGQAAAMRAINLLSEAGINAKVIHMEGAKDPDEYIKRFGAKRFELLLANASDMVEYELNRIKQNCDLKTSEGKIYYLKRSLYVLSEVKNPIEREVYCGMVARESGVSIDTVKAQTGALMKKNIRKREQEQWREIERNTAVTRDRLNPQKAHNLKEAVAEEGVISFLFKNPDYFDKILEKIDSDDFVTEFNKRIFKAIKELNFQNEDISISLLADSFSQEEIGGIAAIIAKNSDKIITEEMVNDYIDILIKHKDKIDLNSVKDMDIGDIEEYRRKLNLKK